MGSIYCYIRVSSKDQHEDRQLITMNDYGVPKRNFYIDKQSGKDFDRPKYKIDQHRDSRKEHPEQERDPEKGAQFFPASLLYAHTSSLSS